MKNKKTTVREAFSNRRVQMVLSVLLAVIAWMVVFFVEPDQDQTVGNILVDLDYNAPAYTSQGLDILERTPVYVSVRVKGNGSSVNKLGAKDFTAYPDYSSVKGEGTYELPITVKKNASFEQYDIISVSQSAVTLTFDKVTTKKFAVTVDAKGLSPAEGYYMDTPAVSSVEVTVSGPETLVNRIDKVAAPIVVTDSDLRENVVTSALLEMRDSAGNVISEAGLKLDTEQVEVTIPILRIKEVPLSLRYTGVPAGYDTTILNAKMSAQTIRVAGTQSQIDALSEVVVGYVDLTNFRLNEDIQFDIELQKGLVNLDNLISVIVSFDTQNLVTKVVSVSEIRQINVPEDMEITVAVPRITNVVLIGTAADLDRITAGSVVAQIDASDVSVVNGQQNVPVTILIPSSKTVFATGGYTVLCEVKTRR